VGVLTVWAQAPSRRDQERSHRQYGRFWHDFVYTQCVDGKQVCILQFAVLLHFSLTYHQGGTSHFAV
jgi:hypothetical protein